MKRDTISDLVAFLAVAREGSFTKTAVKLGLSQSALSHVISGLEARVGLRLLSRTTRSVAQTAAGARLMAMGELCDRPAGKIRGTCSHHATDKVIYPWLAPFLKVSPERLS